MACANHKARPLPLWLFPLFCVGGSARHIICFPLVHSNLPKRGRSPKDCNTFFQFLLALRIWNRPPFICHTPLVSLHNFLHDKHQSPSKCSARRLHAYVDALSTNKNQLTVPHAQAPPWLPNQTHLLAQNKVKPTVLAAVCHIKQKSKCHPQDSVGPNKNSCYPDLYMHIYLGHIF